jgi:DNA polymerase III psi subunit
MDADTSFLKYLIDEEIYIIAERNTSDVENTDLESGKNQYSQYENSTVLLLDYADQSSIPEEHHEFLKKVIKSVYLDPASVENIFNEEVRAVNEEYFNNCTVIAFLKQLPANLSLIFTEERYEVLTSGKNKYLLCDTLEEIIKDTSLKRNLWEQLKILFRIS